jgi:hypothetical protein
VSLSARALAPVLACLALAALAADMALAGEPPPPVPVTPRTTEAAPSTVVYPKRPADLEAMARTDPLGLLREALRWHDAMIKGYTCQFYKVEMVGGKLLKPETMRMKFRVAPFSVYLKWIAAPSEGQEVIYVEGENKGNAWVHPSGLLGVLFRKVSIDPAGKTALKHSRRPVSNAGMGNMLNLIIPQCEAAQTKGDLKLTYEGLQQDAGRTYYVLKRVLPKDKGYPCDVLLIYLDTETLMCARTDAYDWSGELVSHYYYTDVVLNPELTDDDFDPDNKDYNYRLF